MSANADLEHHPVYAALYEPVLLLGLPRSLLGPELTMLALGCYALGWTLASLAFAAVFVGGVHPLLVRMVRDDAEVVEVLLRSLRLADVYQPQAGYASPEVVFLHALREP